MTEKPGSIARERTLRLLDQQGVSYRLLPASEPVYTVEAAARQRGVVREEIVKSILLKDAEGRYAMACVTGEARVDPRRVRAELAGSWSRFHFANSDEIVAVTGCPMGAVTPVGMPESVPVLFDEAIMALPRVSISSGDLTLGIELSPSDLHEIAKAHVARIRA